MNLHEYPASKVARANSAADYVLDEIDDWVSALDQLPKPSTFVVVTRGGAMICALILLSPLWIPPALYHGGYYLLYHGERKLRSKVRSLFNKND